MTSILQGYLSVQARDEDDSSQAGISGGSFLKLETPPFFLTDSIQNVRERKGVTITPEVSACS